MSRGCVERRKTIWITRRGVYHHTHHPSVGSDDTFAISKAVIHITRRGVASVGQREAD